MNEAAVRANNLCYMKSSGDSRSNSPTLFPVLLEVSKCCAPISVNINQNIQVKHQSVWRTNLCKWREIVFVLQLGLITQRKQTEVRDFLTSFWHHPECSQALQYTVFPPVSNMTAHVENPVSKVKWSTLSTHLTGLLKLSRIQFSRKRQENIRNIQGINYKSFFHSWRAFIEFKHIFTVYKVRKMTHVLNTQGIFKWHCGYNWNCLWSSVNLFTYKRQSWLALYQ